MLCERAAAETVTFSSIWFVLMHKHYKTKEVF